MKSRPRSIIGVDPGLEYIELPARESGQGATKAYPRVKGVWKGCRAHLPVVSAVYAGG
jgi:hypothetical protein